MALVLLSCEAAAPVTSPDDGPSLDDRPPTVSWVTPLAGSTITGVVNLEASANDDRRVASVEFLDGAASIGTTAAQPFVLSWQTSGVANGTHKLIVRATDDAGQTGEASLSVIIDNGGVNGDEPPTVRIIAPVADAEVCGTVQIEAAASDDDAVAQVVFSVDDLQVGASSADPFRTAWDTTQAAAGTHVITARATDSAGQVAQHAIQVEVRGAGGASCDTAPTVRITSPSTRFTGEAMVPIAAEASDDVGVVRVEFFVDNARFAEDDMVPYEAIWDASSFAEGPHTIKALAYDTGAQTAEHTIQLTVDRAPPSVRITAPGDGAVVDVGLVDVSVDATDAYGIDRVVVAVDGGPEMDVAMAPYVVQLSGLALGQHTLAVHAWDLAGHRSATVQQTLVVDGPPTVRITSPASGAMIEGLATFEIDATDDRGVTRVDVLVDGASVGSTSTAPFAVLWQTGAATLGAHAVQAVAHDDFGHAAMHEISVTVIDSAPTVAFVQPTQGQTVSGEVAVEVDADDHLGPITLVLTAGGTVINAQPISGSRYGGPWSTCGLSGSVRIEAEVTDARGQQASAQVDVTVDNGAPPGGPFVLAWPEYTNVAALMLSGQKPAHAALTLDGVQVAPPGGTSWSVDVTLVPGTNSYVFDTADQCGRTSGAPVTVSVYLDQTAPTVSLTAPNAGQEVAGMVAIAGTAADDDAVAQVELSLDGSPLTNATTASFQVDWDSNTTMDGAHLIAAVAVDRAGNRSMPSSVMFAVVNGARLVSVEPAPPNNDPAQARSARPSIAVLSTGARAIAWHDNMDVSESGNDDDVLLRVYPAAGGASAVLVVSDHPANARSQNGKAAPDAGGGAHIVWQDDGDIDGDQNVEWDIVYRHYTGGALASTFTVLSGAGRSQFPAIASGANGMAHVVWEDDDDLDGDGNSDKDIVYAVQTAAGFSAPVLISDAPSGDDRSIRPDIAVTPDGCPHIVWSEDGDLAANDNDGQFDVYYRGSSLDAQGDCDWGPFVLISEGSGFATARLPRIAADPVDPRNIVYVAFSADGDVASSGADLDVFVSTVVFGVPGGLLLISDDPADDASSEPAISVSPSQDLHIAWWDNGDIAGTGTDSDVFVRTFDGVALSPIESVSQPSPTHVNTGSSVSPQIAFVGMDRLVVWSDTSNYDGDGVDDSDIMLGR